MVFSDFVAANFFKKESRSPCGSSSARRIRISAENISRDFAKSFSQKIVAGRIRIFSQKKLEQMLELEHQNLTFCKFPDHFGGGAKRRPRKKLVLLQKVYYWCALRDSNPRPFACKAIALPTELSARRIYYI